eukprot:TRINITY_DN9660_c0_g2_i1.p1 TRINITY_DN9660_c0_g2~~TRINITY_DN9660_c0_g2_i1.p1  ORF type:complete len:157 (+),score=2.24 TRINITY_DN9660_c0_g2_i1:362-832(+)
MFCPFPLTELQLLPLLSLVPRLNRLTELELQFRNCKRLTSFNLNLEESSASLVKVIISFDCCSSLRQQGLSRTFTSISRLHALSHLDIKFEGYIVSMSCYRLYFGNCRKLTDKGLSGLVGSISLLQNVKYLAINFDSTTKLSKPMLKALSLLNKNT